MAFFAVLRRTKTLVAAGAIARSFQIQHSVSFFPQSLRSLISLENFESRASLSFSFAKLSSVASKPSSDADLLRVIDVEIKCAEECDDHDRVEEIPEGLPFEIQDREGINTVTLKRNYHGENIEVLVFMPSLVTGDEPETDRKVVDDDEEETRERPSQSSIPLTVNVSKHAGYGLEFCCTAYPDELVIDSVSFKENTESSEEMLAYEGPDFSDLDENLQKSFHKYLELRGISAMTTNFLHEYMINKDSREYLLWLRNLKKLIQK